MASKLAVYDTGYDDERFEQIVSETLHCIICTNVIKDPVMCQRNEHLFCRACITIHLMYSSTCPTCIEPLTVETLRQARTVMNLLSELKIRCEFFDRGCGKFVQLGDLERHVADCGFAPAVCSNEGCQLEVNKQDLLHHETAVCELRRVKCRSCNEIKREMDTMKATLAAISEKFDRNEKTLDRNEKKLNKSEKKLLETLERVEENGKAVKNVAANVEIIRKQYLEERNNREEVKMAFNEITKQLETIIQQTTRTDVGAGQEKNKKEITVTMTKTKQPPIDTTSDEDDGTYQGPKNKGEMAVARCQTKTEQPSPSISDSISDDDTVHRPKSFAVYPPPETKKDGSSIIKGKSKANTKAKPTEPEGIYFESFSSDDDTSRKPKNKKEIVVARCQTKQPSPSISDLFSDDDTVQRPKSFAVYPPPETKKDGSSIIKGKSKANTKAKPTEPEGIYFESFSSGDDTSRKPKNKKEILVARCQTKQPSPSISDLFSDDDTVQRPKSFAVYPPPETKKDGSSIKGKSKANTKAKPTEPEGIYFESFSSDDDTSRKPKNKKEIVVARCQTKQPSPSISDLFSDDDTVQRPKSFAVYPPPETKKDGSSIKGKSKGNTKAKPTEQFQRIYFDLFSSDDDNSRGHKSKKEISGALCQTKTKQPSPSTPVSTSDDNTILYPPSETKKDGTSIKGKSKPKEKRKGKEKTTSANLF